MKNKIHNNDLSNQSYMFLEGLCKAGFGEFPISVLSQFHVFIMNKFGYTPLPLNEKWEEVLNLAEEIFIGDE
ncbi:hypothetical protein I8751_08460 [Nostocaceae cyanobacterium CENA357]|uniref:Uncharacterized protein n=1 Tax=Atlanticothrix silvestris CENA357 TaxID=1725252 RepID=A0A8J7HAQ6_9CYAN|nr:hypothetical protein [Atlanticothrix silvestris]MBH8552406.1 hypothetical protein [Atlanticothrix silvestris CENA357]